MKALLVALTACGGAAHPVAPTPEPVEWRVTLASPHFDVARVRGSDVLVIHDGQTATPGPAAPRTTYVPASELEKLDQEFAAKSAAEGGSAWAAMFAPDGAEWSDGKRVEQAKIGEVMGGVLLGATLEWQATTSGKKDDLGFTTGTYVLQSKHSAERETGSYCTIWKLQPDGSWKVLLDVGSPK